jgi:bifunctional UDP-N-acetylglucosamine pyrophosphorylase/glucosamine-1-phosphate N-acetyltransferase
MSAKRKNKAAASEPAGLDLPNFAIAILAAGQGTRLKSKHPKVLHAVAGKPMLAHVVAAARQLARPENIYAIIGYHAPQVRQALEPAGIGFIVQPEQRGTGHALMVARPALTRYDNLLVLSGDVPLIEPETLRNLCRFHAETRAAMTILTAFPDDPTGYGRIVRAKGPQVSAIVEQKALRGKQLKLREINSGIYVFSTKPLFARLDQLQPNNVHGELYLTDIAALLVKDKEKVVALAAPNAEEVLGVNTRAELAQRDSLLRARKSTQLMASGVTIYRPETVSIDVAVEIGADTIIEPFTHILGDSRIGSGCHIASFCVLRDSEIGDEVEIRNGCVLTEARVRRGAVLGPYAHLRPGSDIGEGAHLGNFVETKKTRLGKGSKANHLSYLGDAEIGDGVNVGAGTITCNYDGIEKHPTVIESGAFIGSDSTLVAPVRIGSGAYVGAASCVTENVPADALVIARSRQINKPGWARKRRESRASAQKAK